MKLKKLQKNLIYLLVLLLPVQLGRHFFFDFSSIAGIVSDYLTPVLYLTDIIIFILIFSDLQKIRKESSKKLILLLIFLLYTCLVIAGNKWAALYKLFKTGEMILLGAVIVRNRPKINTLINAYSMGVLYTSILAIGQFINQRSYGGIWWFFGERTFFASSPGIALGTFSGRLFLRPYATFAHPNLLGGFLALGLPFVYFYLWKDLSLNRFKRVIYTLSLILGTIALVFTFSRASWLVFGLGIILVTALQQAGVKEFISAKKKHFMLIFILFFILSVIVPIRLYKITDAKRGSLYERSQLIRYSLKSISQNPIAGTGLNNAIIRQYRLMPKNLGMFIQQPVHNVYLLILTETGLAGFLFLLVFLKRSFERLNRDNIMQYVPFIMLLLLGFFDHYPVTLQQGQLLTAVLSSFIFLEK